MVDNVSAVIWDVIHDNMALLRQIGARASDQGDVDGWDSVAGEVWRLTQDAEDIITLHRDGLLEPADFDAWLGEIEDLANDAAFMPVAEGE
jgi:hypothetical protein